MLTQGRTKSAGETFALEAQVQALHPEQELDDRAVPETRRIVTLAQRPTSLAELAARLVLPIGVVRVLVGDLTSAGVVSVSRPPPVEIAIDVSLLERLLDGIRTL